jgi:hypothetical protein
LNQIDQDTLVQVANLSMSSTIYDANATAVSTEYQANYTANATTEYQASLANGYNYLLSLDLGSNPLTTTQLN